MKKIKKMIETVIGMVVLLALLGGCAHTSQSAGSNRAKCGRNPCC
ncbi:hypothetical protein VSQ48_18505 [Candidatus Ventrimonas sp. KK005]